MAVCRLGYSRVGVAEVDRYLFDVAALFLDEQRSASMAAVVEAYMADASAAGMDLLRPVDVCEAAPDDA